MYTLSMQKYKRNERMTICIKDGHDIVFRIDRRVCRTCDKVRNNKRYHTDPSYKLWHRKDSNMRYAKARKLINERKNVPCQDCKIKYPPWVMEFDHRTGSDKKFTIGHCGKTMAPTRLIAEMDKCDVVCANCHAERTHRGLDAILLRKKKFPVKHRSPNLLQ